MKNMEDKVKITIYAERNEAHFYMNWESEIHEYLKIFIQMMEFATFHKVTIENAIIEAAEIIKENREKNDTI